MFSSKFYIYPKQNGKWCGENGSTPTAIPSQYVDYGGAQTFSLDETLDTCIIEIARVKEKESIEPFTICRIENYKDNVLKEKLFYCIYQDKVELTNPVKQTYTHTLTLIEPIKLLERYLLPNNKTFTRTKGYKTYDIDDVISTILYNLVNQMAGGKTLLFNAEPISNATAPDFNFNNRNALEALMEIGRYIGCIPTLRLNDEMKPPFQVVYIPVRDNAKEEESITSEVETQEPTQFTDGFRSNIVNMVLKDEEVAAITYPSRSGIAFPRSELGQQLTNETMKVFLPSPIYKFRHLTGFTKIPKTMDIGKGVIGYPCLQADFRSGNYIYYYIKKLPTTSINSKEVLFTYDLTNALREKTVYAALPPVHIPDPKGLGKFKKGDFGKYQDTSIPWERNSNTLDITGEYTYKNWLGMETTTSLAANLMAVAIVEQDLSGDILGRYPDATNIHASIGIVYSAETGFFQNTIPATKPLDINSLDSFENFGFRVEYIPFIEGTIDVAKKDGAQRLPSNQQANIVDAEAWGKNQEATLDRTSLPTREITKHWKEWPNIMVGDKINGYFVMQESRAIHPLSVESKYVMTKGYNRISQYTALDSKWRETSIETTQILNRDYDTHDYLSFSTELPPAELASATNIKDFAAIKEMLTNTYTSQWKINTSTVFTYDDGLKRKPHYLCMPVNSISVGNTMRFEIAFKDYLNAGMKQKYQTINGKTVYNSIAVPYTDEHGYSVCFQDALYHDVEGSEADYKRLPEYDIVVDSLKFTPATSFFTQGWDESYWWNKDQREAMRIVHNIHCIKTAEAGLTDRFVARCPLVSDVRPTGKLKWYYLNKPFVPNRDKVTAEEIKNSSTTVDIEDAWNYDLNMLSFKTHYAAPSIVCVDDDLYVYAYLNNTAADKVYYLYPHSEGI